MKVVPNYSGMQILMKQIDAKVDLASNQVVDEAKRVVPVRTGNLRDSIEKKKVAEMHYRVGSEEDYALYVEVGTSKMSAQPYLRRALLKIKEIFK